jgi:cell wall-associated NlpC family hydrolase
MSPTATDQRSLDRVQGIDSSLNDLVLRDGRQFAVELGGSIIPTPTITRTIDGSSSVKFTIHDHDLDFLDAEMLNQKLDAQIDGLWFRLMGADLDGPQIGITLQDREIAILSEHTEPVSVYREPKNGPKTTRAEFLVGLVRKALPHAPIYCPQLHNVQPIETERQGKKAGEDAKENRGKGLGAAKGLKVKGAAATPAQLDLGERALRVAESHKAPFRVSVALIAALIDESEMGAASSNVLQAEPFIAQGASTSAEAEIAGFLTGKNWTGTGAIPYFKAHPQAEPADIATNVQHNRDGASSYAPFVAEAREWVELMDGGEFAGGSRTVEEPYKFEVCVEEGGEKQDKNWWEGIKREAKVVNWRAFFVAGRFLFLDEIELFRGMVRWAIDRETPGIQKVKGSWRANRPATDITIEAFASHWKVPPGGVATIGGYGPYSIGFGDAPLKKGQVGISNNRNAKTGEGHARYLLETIESPLRDSDVSDLKLITAKLRKPTAPLPEPAAKTKTLSAGSGGGKSPLAPADAPPEIAAMLAEMEALEGTPYKWGGGHDSVATRESEYDCSGALSRVFHVAGLLDEPLTSGAMAKKFEAGKGDWFVLYANAAHAWCEIRTSEGWKEWEEGGANGDHAGFLSAGTQSPSGYSARHPRGL